MDKYKFEQNFIHIRPSRPFHLKILMKAKKGCSDFYNKLINDALKGPISRIKWEDLVDDAVPNFWGVIYKTCFKSISDNDLKWFQYKVINNILATKHYLYKVKISDCNECQLCNSHPETISHLFSKCKESEELWKNVNSWILNRTGIALVLTNTMKILGYTVYDENFWPVNFILIMVRYYIYCCSKRKQLLNIFQLQKDIKKIYVEQKLLSEINGKFHTLNKMWSTWQHLFTNI